MYYNGRLTDCWLTVRLGGSGLGLLRLPEKSVGAGVGGVGDGGGGAGGDPVADDRGRSGRLLQLVGGGGGGLLVEDDGTGAAREKRERKVLRSLSLFLARWKWIAILVASGGSDAQDGRGRREGEGEMSGAKNHRSIARSPPGEQREGTWVGGGESEGRGGRNVRQTE